MLPPLQLTVAEGPSVPRMSLLARLGFQRKKARPNETLEPALRSQAPPKAIRRHAARRSRTAIFSLLLGYLGIQLAFIIWADTTRPGMYDPEYYGRERILLERRAEHPDRPLLLLMGSSRSVNLFRPERLEPFHTPDGRQVLVFNYSHTYAGPTYMYLSYRRLLDKGIVPRWIVLEIMPVIARKQEKTVYTGSIVAHEFPWLCGQHETGDLAVEYLKSRLLPWERLRTPIMHNWFPRFDVSRPNFLVRGDYEKLGGLHFEPDDRAVDPEGVARALRDAVAARGPLIRAFAIDPRAERSMHALADLCRQNGTRIAVLLGPESPAFRLNYSLEAYGQIRDFFARWANEIGAPFLDAREWLDEADFNDGHHAVFSGQTKFTDRLANELLRDWVRE